MGERMWRSRKDKGKEWPEMRGGKKKSEKGVTKEQKSTDRIWSFRNQLMPAAPHCPEGDLKEV